MAREFSLKRIVDGARCVGCREGGCLPEMGAPGTVGDVSTARLEYQSVEGPPRHKRKQPLPAESYQCAETW
ncbi:MAG: hypothetical protein ACJAQ3_002269 [Planctomycetota bacterium]|jgi:hypothetical protein